MKISKVVSFVILLALLSISIGCAPADKTLAEEKQRDVTMREVFHLIVDDFKVPSGSQSCEEFNSDIWPVWSDEETDDAGMAEDCQREVRPNFFGECPEVFVDADQNGKICAEYIDAALHDTPGPFLKLSYQLETIKDHNQDAFGFLLEPLTTAEGASLDLQSAGFINLILWVHVPDTDIDMEVSLKDSKNNETNRKRLISQYIPKPKKDGWSEVSIPLDDLAKNQDGENVDISNVSAVIFSFARRRFIEVTPKRSLRGSIYIDVIMFE